MPITGFYNKQQDDKTTINIKNVIVNEFGQLKQHDKTAKNQQKVQQLKEKRNRQKQQFLDAGSSNIPDRFTFDLTNALISANIPFAKINNNGFRKFLEEQTGKHIPRAQTLWNYLEPYYEKVKYF